MTRAAPWMTRPDDLGWLDALTVDPDRWAPLPYENTVIVLNPVLRVERTSEAVRKTPQSWLDLASETGLDPEWICAGYPNPQTLREAAIRSIPEALIEWPATGFASLAVKGAIIALLSETDTDQLAVVGLYTGGHGEVAADWLVVEPVLREVGALEFGFVEMRLADLLDLWSAPGSTSRPHLDPPDMSFLWPADHRWFFHADPDSAFVTLSTDAHLAHRLLADESVECWSADPAGPRGVHIPAQRP